MRPSINFPAADLSPAPSYRGQEHTYSNYSGSSDMINTLRAHKLLFLGRLRARRALCAASNKPPQWLDPKNAEHQQWVRNMRCFIFDIDGVIHTPAGPIAGAAHALRRLRQEGIAIRFLTNNATKTPETIVGEFATMGIEASTSEITTSGDVAADYLRSQRLSGSRAYVIGERALCDALSTRAGVRAFGGPDDAGKSM